MSLDIQEEQQKLQPFSYLGQKFAVMLVTKGKNGHDNKRPINAIHDNGAVDYMHWKENPKFTQLRTAFVNLGKTRKRYPKRHVEVGVLLSEQLMMLDIDNIYNEIVKKDEPNSLLSKLHQLTKGTYCEISQSGKGIHFFFTGTKTRKETTNDKYELYAGDGSKLATLTGNTIWGTSQIKHLSEQEMSVLEQFLWGDPKPKRKSANSKPDTVGNSLADDALLKKIRNSKQADKFETLWSGDGITDDASSNDMALVDILVWWTNHDLKRADKLFRKSGLMRDKWNETHSVDGKTYGEMTLERADEEVAGGYTGKINQQTQKRSFKSMKELTEALKQASLEWRKANADEDGNICPLNKMPATVKLSLIYQLEPLAILVTNTDDYKETKATPISYYDWNDGVWEDDYQTLESMLLAVDPTIVSTKTRQNYIDTLQRSPMFDIPIKQLSKVRDKDHRYTPVGNGVFDNQEKKLLPYDPEKWFFKSKAGTNYNDQATVEPICNGWSPKLMIKQFATDPATGEINTAKEKLLWQVLKAGVTGADWLRKSVILVDDGSGNSGKSTFTDIIAGVLGNGNVANLRLIDLQDATKLLDAVSASTIIGDDNDPEIPITKFDNFNTVVSGDPLRVRDYYKRSYSTRLHCFVIQSANGLPTLTGAKTAVYNRLIVIDFKTHFDPSKQADWNVKHDYIKRKEVKEWLLWYLLNKVELGIALTDTEESQRLLKQTHAESDTVYAFAEEMLDQIPSNTVPSSYMYALYYNYCRVNNTRAVTRRKFSMDLQKKEKFKKEWVYLPKSCYLENPETYVDSTQEGTCAKLLNDLAGQVGNYNTQSFSLDVQKRYVGSGFKKVN